MVPPFKKSWNMQVMKKVQLIISWLDMQLKWIMQDAFPQASLLRTPKFNGCFLVTSGLYLPPPKLYSLNLKDGFVIIAK
jgi:hypothetical protein